MTAIEHFTSWEDKYIIQLKETLPQPFFDSITAEGEQLSARERGPQHLQTAQDMSAYILDKHFFEDKQLFFLPFSFSVCLLNLCSPFVSW